MKDLPRVYANPINKEFKNFKREDKINEYEEKVSISPRNLSMKIKDIFNRSDYIYKKRVRIHTSLGTEEHMIIGKTVDYLLTMQGKKIKYTDILDIEVI